MHHQRFVTPMSGYVHPLCVMNTDQVIEERSNEDGGGSSSYVREADRSNLDESSCSQPHLVDSQH